MACKLPAPIVLALALSACGAPPATATQPSEQPKPAAIVAEPAFRLTATIQELMDSEVNPSADFLWDSVGSISSLAGFEEKQPHTDEQWQEVRRHAITLLEATNLLAMNGRRVSRQYFRSADASELDSTEIQHLLDANHPAFVAFAQSLHDAGSKLLTAIDAKDANALFDAGSGLDDACESCHKAFWYPKRAPPNL